MIACQQHARPTIHRSSRHRRRAAAYFFFLGASMLVMVIALSAITALRIRVRTDGIIDDATAARHYALSAVDFGFFVITQDRNWRTTKASGTWLPTTPIGSGDMTLQATVLTDADGNFENNPLLFLATGRAGDAIHRIEVRLSAVTDEGGIVPDAGSWRRDVN